MPVPAHPSPIGLWLGRLELPPVYLAGFLLLSWLQARFLPLGDAGRVGDWLGLGLIIGGAQLMAASLWQFAVHRTTVIPRSQATALIERGVYLVSRNPIYLADTLILAGFGLRWDLASLLLVPLFMAVIQVRFIAGEEAAMGAAFGAKYAAYRARTRRWL